MKRVEVWGRRELRVGRYFVVLASEGFKAPPVLFSAREDNAVRRQAVSPCTTGLLGVVEHDRRYLDMEHGTNCGAVDAASERACGTHDLYGRGVWVFPCRQFAILQVDLSVVVVYVVVERVQLFDCLLYTSDAADD